MFLNFVSIFRFVDLNFVNIQLSFLSSYCVLLLFLFEGMINKCSRNFF